MIIIITEDLLVVMMKLSLNYVSLYLSLLINIDFIFKIRNIKITY